jgi:methyltransferase (TIGR00027 family)
MQAFKPSLTALRVARLRARHQSSADAALFRDPYAVPILGEGEPSEADLAGEDLYSRQLRLFVATRSRFAEDSLSRAVERGVSQAVVLGAGLDTLSLRNPHADKGLRIFEVDHPGTQAWKRERIAAAGLAEPAAVRFVAVDFETEKLSDQLHLAGYRIGAPGFFIWLGVVPYLTRDAIFDTLGFIAGVAGSEVVFDYSEPRESRPPAAQAAFDRRAARVAKIGEPWLSFFAPTELAASLADLGFDELEDLDASGMAARYPRSGPPPKAGSGAHLMRARRSA